MIKTLWDPSLAFHQKTLVDPLLQDDRSTRRHYHPVGEKSLTPMFGAHKVQCCLVGQTINISCMMNPLRLLITKLSSLYRKLAMGAHSVVSKMNLLKYIQSGLHSEIKSASRVNPLGDIAAGAEVVLVSPQNHVIASMLTSTNPCSNDIAEYDALLAA